MDNRLMFHGLTMLVISSLYVFGCGAENNDNDDSDWLSGGDADADADADSDADSDSDTDSSSPGVADYTCIVHAAWYYDTCNETELSFDSRASGEKNANAYGLYDMLGNVIEWTSDCYHESYSGMPNVSSTGVNLPWTDGQDCDTVVVRGGCVSSPASTLRVSRRESATKTAYGACTTGVRCARDLADGDSIVGSTQDVEWRLIPAGTFTMGCTDPGPDGQCATNEQPTTTVSLNSFYMMSREISGRDYFAITGNDPKVSVDFPERAAQKVYYDDATLFCAGIGGRIPTEAEWEYAARGGVDGAFYCQYD